VTEQARSSIASRAAVWAALPATAPGLDAFAITAASRLTEAFARATLHDLLMAGAIQCGRNRRERTHYWRAVPEMPSFEQAEAMQGRKQRMCLGCRRPFSSHGPGNRICQQCAGRDDPLRDVSVATRHYLEGCVGAVWYVWGVEDA
jgi:hypothetical protein